MKLFASTALAVLAASATAVAAPISLTFNLQLSGGYAGSLSVASNEDPFYSITVTALTHGSPSAISRLGTDGLGVKSWLLDQDDVDGFGFTQALVFTPSFPLVDARLLSLSFTNLDRFFDGDEASILLDGSSVFCRHLSTMVSSASFSSSAFSNNVRAQTTDADDNFGVREIRIQVEAVPEPGTVSLLGLGLLGLGWIARKRG